MSHAAPAVKNGFLTIPVNNGSEELDLNLGGLAGGSGEEAVDFDFVRELLQTESPPVVYWCLIAHFLLSISKVHEAELLCKDGLHSIDQRSRVGGAKVQDLMPLHNLLASIALRQARGAPQQILPEARYKVLNPAVDLVKSHHLAQADRHLKEAEQLSSTNARLGIHPQLQQFKQLTLLSRAISFLMQGNNDQASSAFDLLLKIEPHHTIALMGKGCLLLRKKNYADALKIYQQVLQISLYINSDSTKGKEGAHAPKRWTGPDPRIGIGLALWGLNRFDEARRAWSRSLALDTNSHSARTLLGLSALHLNGSPHPLLPLQRKDEEKLHRETLYNDGIHHLEQAFKIENRNSILATALCGFFTNKALALINSGLLKTGAEAEWANVRNLLLRALKLGEHAIQFADSARASIQAKLHHARALHIMSYLPGGDVALRPLAQRFYGRVLEESSRQISDGRTIPASEALAAVGLAQIQISTGSEPAAIETLSKFIAKTHNSGSHALEIILLIVSLGIQKEASPLLLERALKMVEAAKRQAERLDQNLEDDAEIVFPASADFSRSSLFSEMLSLQALDQVADTGRDPLLWIQLANLVQIGDTALATRCYVAALQSLHKAEEANSGVLSNRDQALMMRLRSNLGALLALQAIEAENEEARKSFSDQAGAELQTALVHASKVSQGSSDHAAAEAVRVISLYNLGRVYEVVDVTKAEEAYRTVLTAHPEYVDAKVRLGLLQAIHDRDAANSLFKEAISGNLSNFDTRLIYAAFLAGELPGAPTANWMQVRDFLADVYKGDTPLGLQSFGTKDAAKKIQDRAQQDSPMLAALGWAYYQAFVAAKPGPNLKADRTKSFFRAIDLFSRALTVDKYNAFAAQGLAILLAEDALGEASIDKQATGISQAAQDMRASEVRKKSADEAISILNKLREIKDEASVHICLGNALMVRDDFDRAIKSYEIAASKTGSADASVLQNLARAEYAKGISAKNTSNLWTSLDYLGQAREQLEKKTGTTAAIECNWIRFNEAVTRQKLLQTLNELTSAERSSEEIQRAIEGHNAALKVFKELEPIVEKGQLAHVGSEMLDQRYIYGEQNLASQSQKMLSEQLEYERAIREAREEAEALLAQKQAKKDQLNAERRAEEQRRAQEIALKREAAKEKLGELDWAVLSAAANEKPKKSSSGGKKKKSQREEEEDLGIDPDDDEEDADALFGDEAAADDSGKAAKALSQLKRKKAALKKSKKKPAASSGSESDGSDAERPKKKSRGKAKVMDDDDIIDSDEEV